MYIEGAIPGDVLEGDHRGDPVKGPGDCDLPGNLRACGDFFTETTYKITPIRDNMVVFDRHLQIPAIPWWACWESRPGPAHQLNLNGVWGGNMDNTMMRQGVTLYLPIEVEGALAGTGDVHAVMGDGEMNCSAVEAPAFVTLKFNVRKDIRINEPVLCTQTHFVTIATRPTADEAIRDSTREMFRYIKTYRTGPGGDFHADDGHRKQRGCAWPAARTVRRCVLPCPGTPSRRTDSSAFRNRTLER